MIITRAPLRIPLGGGGTDFPSYFEKYGGYILGFALDKYVYVVVHKTIDKVVRLKYSKSEVVSDIDYLENRVAAETLKYMDVTSNIEVATFSDVPEASGLGGSSAFCVALLIGLKRLKGLPLNKQYLFKEAYHIERELAGQPGGLQDQWFASRGNAWRLLLSKGLRIEADIIEVSGLLPYLKLVYTGSGRTSLVIADQQDKGVTEENEAVLASLHKTKELGLDIESYLLSNQFDKIGSTFHKHWESKKLRSNHISTLDIDTIYGVARASGAVGGKLLGLGGGGYFLFYSENGLPGLDYLHTLSVGLDSEGVKVIYEG